MAGCALAIVTVLASLREVPAYAQDALPSVGDYRFPRATPKPTARPQGPVDDDVPVVKEVLRAEPSPESAPPVRATSSAVPTPQPSPSATASAKPAILASSKPPAAPSPTVSANAKPSGIQNAVSIKPAPQPVASATPVSAVAKSAQAANPSIEPSRKVAVPAPVGPTIDVVPAVSDASGDETIKWNVHSAKDAKSSAGSKFWLALAGMAFALGVAITFLLQKLLLKRQKQEAQFEDADWDINRSAQPSIQPVEEPAHLHLTEGDVTEMPAPHFDLPKAVEYVTMPQADNPPAAEPVIFSELPSNAEEAIHGAPLGLNLAARRLSATLMNTVLDYELVVSNNSYDTIGPIMIGGDMIAAHASLPTRAQLELTGHSIAPLHTVPTLLPGKTVVLNGQLRLALAAITPIRNGNASLFVPLARFRAEALRKGQPPVVVNQTSVIGESQGDETAALKPFRLDLGPRLYSEISQRELAQVA